MLSRPFLSSPIGLHPTIPLKPSFPRLFFFVCFVPFPSASTPHAAKLLDKIPKRESFHHKTSPERLSLEKKVEYPATNVCSKGNKEVLIPGFAFSRQGEEEGNGNLMKGVDLCKEIKKEKKGRKGKFSLEEVEFRIGLDMCSKSGDVLGALSIYEEAVRNGLILQKYHYNVLLYLCSSASTGFVYPGKSGSSGSSNSSDNGSMPQNLSKQRGLGSRKMPKLKHLNQHSVHFEADVSLSQRECGAMKNTIKGEIFVDKSSGGAPVQISDDVKAYARRRGFEIYDKMRMEKVPKSEAAMTSVARMAMSMGDGDMAFEIVKQMKAMGISPKLRSYGPSILTFSSSGSVEKAFEVERHMLELGITPEENELEALLRASVEAGRGEKVYYLLHKLRSTVRQVSLSIADVIDAWFRSSTASRFGKRKWDDQTIKRAVENCGGGWHGLGWLGKGKWNVVRAHVDGEGVCLSCREKLATVDLDPIETDKFSKSVESIVFEREKSSNFEEFKKWLKYYGPFEAVIDAANVGLYNQRRFSLNKVNAIANAIRQKLPSKKWPLIIVHNKRLLGGKMNEPFNKKLIEKWKNADAIYATPTGSNDDWYWLYAAIKCKCLVVTNDEMRDHIFQVLGNDFFNKWKEKHQVHFLHQDGSFQFQMPSPFSVVIQESERGHWHIPIAEHEQGQSTTWMCVTRRASSSTILTGLNTSSSPPTSKLLPSCAGLASSLLPRARQACLHSFFPSVSVSPSQSTSFSHPLAATTTLRSPVL